ncbi:MAG: hypothetical protein ABSG69_04375 [Candidatus Acidiferrum sp.]
MRFLKKLSLAAVVSLSFAFAGVHAAQVKAAGMILDSQGGHIGSAATSAGSSIYAGDILSTDMDGTITVRVGQTTYQLLGDTTAVFYIGQTSPIAELRHGVILVSNNSASQGFEIYASDVRIVSGTDRPIQGQVSLRSPCELTVKTQEGLMDVVAGSEKKTVDHDHAYRVIPEHSVDKTRDAISPEDPDYHKHHTHTGCAAAYANSGKAPLVLANSHFTEVAIGAVVAVSIVGVSKAYESPDRP